MLYEVRATYVVRDCGDTTHANPAVGPPGCAHGDGWFLEHVR